MGFVIALQDAHGRELDRVEDPSGSLGKLLPTVESHGFHLLPYIDRYADTIFNGAQMEPFLREWLSLAPPQDSSAVWRGVEALARRCHEEPHLYLRFIGD